jgi:serine/threonine-protein kinase
MPPEVLVGHELAGAEGDLYAVGVLAYELLTGRCPYSGATVEEVEAAHEAGADAVTDARPEIDVAIEVWMHRALHREPARRFPTAKSLAEAFDALVPQPVSRRVALAA